MNTAADTDPIRDDSDVSQHIPVLVEPLMEWIKLPTDGIMVDATVGHGGHSGLFGQMLGPEGRLLGLDVDHNSIQRASQHLSGLSCRVELVRANFDRLADLLAERGIEKVDCILADLGFCSGQLEDVQRGLSFQKAMPLDMRLDDRLKTTAADLVNRLSQTELADLIYRYGQDRASRRIARFIVEQRQRQKITTTAELAGLICRALKAPARGHRIHPATRTFQALRIAVNDELGRLQTLLDAAPNLLKPGGMIAVISFHSLEDGMVKNDFRQKKSEGVYEVLTKKPIQPTRDEATRNPRSRSAKLRIAKRL
ncbi:MAG: 16S rRNA (cytosine(1402)-N(4))-methyltransferase RsmH [Phycisphaerae bacterium]|nr:16S rRNA (cytosine(1402)-N(4))-methyltransferase RsmH [Phycisphaerae bacterium]